MLLTKAETIRRLKAETGRSVEWCIGEAERLAVVPDGKRQKAHAYQLDQAIKSANQLPAVHELGIRPISEQKRRRLLADCY